MFADAMEDCSPIATFPWTEDFESYSEVYNMVDYCWQYKTGILSAQTMFYDVDYDDYFYFYFSSFANTGDNALVINLYDESAVDWMISPAFDLGDGSVHYALSFDMALTDYESTSHGNFEADDYYAILISTDRNNFV